MEELERVNKDPRFLEYMSDEEDLRKRENTMIRNAEEAGIEQGIEQGIEKGRLDSARKLIDKGFSKDEVVNMLDISESELEKI